jgi:hypothetical protein
MIQIGSIIDGCLSPSLRRSCLTGVFIVVLLVVLNLNGVLILNAILILNTALNLNNLNTVLRNWRPWG